MKRKLVYRPDSLIDFDEAQLYTLQAWGREPAKRYIAALVADIKTLRISALRHPIHDDVHPELRRKRSGMHHIYYLASDGSVEVLNIIHVQRDPGLHLKTEAWRDMDNK